MNYPKTLINPIYQKAPEKKSDIEDLNYIY